MIALLAALALTAQTHECQGLQRCVPVRGPWVVVTRAETQYELTCPKGYIVGGTDAELTDRSIDLSFLAKSGSPVAPGNSTSRTVVFVARLTGSAGVATFRPHAGCVPSAGGGRRTPTAYTGIVPPGSPTVRRTKTVRVTTARRIGVACELGERLVGTNVARGFATESPPSHAAIGRVRTTARVANGGILVHARGTTGAVVQVTAICAGGR